MPFDATDLESMVDESMPGYATVTAGGRTFPALFRSHVVDPLSGVVDGENRYALARASDLSGIGYGSSIVIAGVTYVVRGISAGDTGMVRVKLESA